MPLTPGRRLAEPEKPKGQGLPGDQSSIYAGRIWGTQRLGPRLLRLNGSMGKRLIQTALRRVERGPRAMNFYWRQSEGAE